MREKLIKILDVYYSTRQLSEEYNGECADEIMALHNELLANQLGVSTRKEELVHVSKVLREADREAGEPKKILVTLPDGTKQCHKTEVYPDRLECDPITIAGKPDPRPVCARCGGTKQYSGYCGECYAWTETGNKPIHADDCQCNDCKD